MLLALCSFLCRYAALVVVRAVVCAWLVFLVTILSRCVLLDCRQARVAWHHGALGQGCSLRFYATTGLMVQTVQMYVFVQFLNKVGDVPIVGPHGPHNAEARGDSTGAVLGRGYGHYDRCHGPDSANRLEVPQLQVIFKVVDSYCGAEADPRGPGGIPQLLCAWLGRCSRLFVAPFMQRQVSWSRQCRICAFRQLLDKVADVPVFATTELMV